MPPELLAPARPARRPHLRLLDAPPLRIVDVALRPGEGLRAYLEAKARHARETGAFTHEVVLAGGAPLRRAVVGLRPEVALAGSVPLRRAVVGLRPEVALAGAVPVRGALAALRPEVVLLHDLGWRTREALAAAREAGARVVVVEQRAPLRGWQRRLAATADASLALRLGLEPAFRPRADVPRGDHVLCVGGDTPELLEAAAAAPDPWPLWFAVPGPREQALRERAARLGLEHRVSFLPAAAEPERRARLFAGAACVVAPGDHAALEAAAAGARVVTWAGSPGAAAVGPLGHLAVPGDVAGLAGALASARATPQDLVAAAALAWRHGWARVFAAELAAMRRIAAG